MEDFYETIFEHFYMFCTIFVHLLPMYGGGWTIATATASDSPITTHSLIGNRHVSGIYYGSVELNLTVLSSGPGVLRLGIV